MNQRARLIAVFFAVIAIAAVILFYLLKAPLALYIGWGSTALAVAIMHSILPGSLSIIQIALMTSFILATGAIVAEIGLNDPLAAWFFLIAAVFSIPIVLVGSRYLRSTWLEEQEGVPEPETPKLPHTFWQRLGELFIKGFSLGSTAVLLVITSYLAWRTWPKVSGNALMLATLLLIFLALGSMTVKRVDKRPEHWLSAEGLRALSGLLSELLLPVIFVLLLLNFVVK